MIRTTAYLAITLALALPAFHAAGAESGDAARGRVLYERNCGKCHAPGIHGRTARTPLTRDELRVLVETFRRRAKLDWTPQDVEDVVEHLDTMSYRLPREEKR